MIDLTLSIAKHLVRGDILYHKTYKNADGTPERWRVNGIVRTWKRDPHRIEVPLKRGLYSYWTAEATTLDQFMVEDHVADRV